MHQHWPSLQMARQHDLMPEYFTDQEDNPEDHLTLDQAIVIPGTTALIIGYQLHWQILCLTC